MFYSPFVPFIIMEFLMKKKLLRFFLVSWEIARLQSTCAIRLRVKPERKRVRKCRAGRRKIRKIKVLTISRHQHRYSGQIGYNPGNLIEINIINNLSSKSTCKESFCINLFRWYVWEKNRNKGIFHRSGNWHSFPNRNEVETF